MRDLDVWFDGRDFSPFVAFRFGEAENPGPEDVVVAVINPTTVLSKLSDIASLPADVVLAAETAATRYVQAKLAFNFGLSVCRPFAVWGDEFTDRLQRWAAHLQWPPLPRPVELSCWCKAHLH